jgi:hypothetical protein
MVVAEGLFSSLYLEWQVGRINPQNFENQFSWCSVEVAAFSIGLALDKIWGEKVQRGLGVCFLGGSPFPAKRVLIQPIAGWFRG